MIKIEYILCGCDVQYTVGVTNEECKSHNSSYADSIALKAQQKEDIYLILFIRNAKIWRIISQSSPNNASDEHFTARKYHMKNTILDIYKYFKCGCKNINNLLQYKSLVTVCMTFWIMKGLILYCDLPVGGHFVALTKNGTDRNKPFRLLHGVHRFAQNETFNSGIA